MSNAKRPMPPRLEESLDISEMVAFIPEDDIKAIRTELAALALQEVGVYKLMRDYLPWWSIPARRQLSRNIRNLRALATEAQTMSPSALITVAKRAGEQPQKEREEGSDRRAALQKAKILMQQTASVSQSPPGLDQVELPSGMDLTLAQAPSDLASLPTEPQCDSRLAPRSEIDE